MNLTRKLATAALTLAATAGGLGLFASAADAGTTYDDTYTASFLNGYHSASVNYRSEGFNPDMYIQVWDNANDNYCSAVEYRYIYNGQVSPRYRTGTACGGAYRGFSIPSGNWGPLATVRVEFRAVTGNYVGQTISCWNGTDTHNGVQDFCR